MKKLLVLASLVILLAACGGGGGSGDNDRVLHFTARDETEGNFRSRIRAAFNDGGATTAGLLIWCQQIKDLKPSEALNIVRNDDPNSSTVFPGATPRPGQTAIQADLVRSAEIIQEECKRLPI